MAFVHEPLPPRPIVLCGRCGKNHVVPYGKGDECTYCYTDRVFNRPLRKVTMPAPPSRLGMSKYMGVMCSRCTTARAQAKGLCRVCYSVTRREAVAKHVPLFGPGLCDYCGVTLPDGKTIHRDCKNPEGYRAWVRSAAERERHGERVEGAEPFQSPKALFPAGTPLYILSKKSGAAKTDGCATTYSPRPTCPPSCGLYRTKGCYAEAGWVGMHWDRIDRGEAGKPWKEHLEDIRGLRNTRIRLNVAGDLPGIGDAIDEPALLQLAEASTANGKTAWVYTHKPPTLDNLAAMHRAVNRGLAINLSADSIFAADKLVKTGLPVTAVVPMDMQGPLKTPGGVPVYICPAQTSHDKLTCGTCGGDKGPLCWRKSRPYIVGFRTHGISEKKASSVAWAGMKPLPLFAGVS